MKTHIRFVKKNKKDNKGNLRLDCNVNGIRFRKYLNIKINEVNWNKNKERIKSNFSNAFEINKRLNYIINSINQIYYELINDEIPISKNDRYAYYKKWWNSEQGKSTFNKWEIATKQSIFNV